jgi:hypothetical protein
MYVGIHVKYPLFLSDFNDLKFSRQIFEISSNTKFNENPSSGIRVVACGRTDRRRDTTKLTVDIRNFANAPQNL